MNQTRRSFFQACCGGIAATVAVLSGRNAKAGFKIKTRPFKADALGIVPTGYMQVGKTGACRPTYEWSSSVSINEQFKTVMRWNYVGDIDPRLARCWPNVTPGFSRVIHIYRQAFEAQRYLAQMIDTEI